MKNALIVYYSVLTFKILVPFIKNVPSHTLCHINELSIVLSANTQCYTSSVLGKGSDSPLFSVFFFTDVLLNKQLYKNC